MTSVSLREYHKDIEIMIEGGQINEAIAHCQHILKAFPMNLDTYRFLGKAYLESRKYHEAADIFKRLLTSVPDDFVANVGMSIIREDEKDLDSSIWHMERAFEVQPSNSAIQEELRKLYGRRDGVEPSKVRLTRDALANMYAQGALYSQAIAEIKSVLAEDPDRPDLKVMLARAYSKDGRKKQSIEICTEIIKEYPYCFDALRILVNLLQSVENQQLVSGYKSRIYALDPYSEFVNGSIFDSQDVADESVMVEYLKTQSDLSQDIPIPVWSPEAGNSEGEKVNVDQNKNIGDQKPAKDELKNVESGSSLEEILMKSKQDDHNQKNQFELESIQQPFSSKPDSSSQIKPNENADIPDWIKELAPGDSEDELDYEGISADLVSEMDSIEKTKAKPPIIEEKVEDETLDEIPGWLKELGTDELFKDDEQDKSQLDPGLVDNQGSLQDESQLPEWLLESQSDISFEENSSEIDEYDLPEWLKGFESEKAKENLLHVDGFDPSTHESIEDTLFEKSETPNPSEVADTSAEADVIEEPVLEGRNELEDLSSDRLYAEDTITSDIESSSMKTDQPEQIEPSSVSDPVLPEEQPVDLNEEDAAFAWLESLAARQGANPEELTTKQEVMNTEPPDWIKKALGEKPGSDLHEMDSTSDEHVEEIFKSEEPLSIKENDLDSQTSDNDWISITQSEEESQKEKSEEELLPSVEEIDLRTTITEEGKIEEIKQPSISGEWKPIEEITSELDVEKLPDSQSEFVASNEEISQLTKVPVGGSLTKIPGRDIDKESEILEKAQLNLERRDLLSALDEYRRLIKKGKLLEGVIHDLKEISYLFPVDVSVWQALGDAYMRANQLQDALDSYTKAEELLR